MCTFLASKKAKFITGSLMVIDGCISSLVNIAKEIANAIQNGGTLYLCGNDYSFDEIFERALEGLGKKGNLILEISISGKSKNVIEAFEKAKEIGIKPIGFLGCEGGSMLEYCNLSFIVPSFNTSRIQESHVTAGHVV